MRFIFNKKIIFSFGAIAAVFFFSRIVFAVWDGFPYDPGDTLNPECLPTDTDCDVRAPLTSTSISDTVYGAGWDTDTTHAPSKNAVYDKIETVVGSAHDALTLGTANGLSLAAQVLSMGLASTSTTGALSDTDWDTFNNKANALGADDNYVTDAEKIVIGNTSGTNTGDQTSIVGITGTLAQFNTAVTDAELARTDAAQTFTGLQTFSTSPTSPGSGTNSERYGAGASTSTVNYSLAVGAGASTTHGASVALGANASVSGQDNGVAIGYGATVSGNWNGSIAIGSGATTSCTNGICTAIGYSATASGQNAHAIGYQANAANVNSFALGYGATTSATGQFVLGSNAANINDAYLGQGVTAATPSGFSINASGGSGTNIAGANLTLAGGKGTGNAAGGSLIFSTSDAGASGTTLQSLTEKFRITAAGQFLGGNGSASAPTYSFTNSPGSGIYATDANGMSFSAASGGKAMSIYNNDLRMIGRILNGSTGVFAWANSTAEGGSLDSGLSRVSAGVVGVGNGAAGSFAGTLKTTSLLTDGITGITNSGIMTISSATSQNLTINSPASLNLVGGSVINMENGALNVSTSGVSIGGSPTFQIDYPGISKGRLYMTSSTLTFFQGTPGLVGLGVTTPSQLLTLKSTGSMAWDNGSGTADTGLSRISANVIGVGNGAAGDFSGTLKATTFEGALTGNADTVTGLSVTSGKTLTVNNSLTLAGTDSTTMTFPSTSATLARTDAAQTFTGLQTFSTSPTSPGASSYSEVFGASAVSGADKQTIFGNSATGSTYVGATAFGRSASAGGTFSTAIGYRTSVTGNSGLAVGGPSSGAENLTTAANGAVSVGLSTNAAHSGSFLLGTNITSTASGQFIVGSGISNVYIGDGVTDATPLSVTYNASGGSGTDIAGASLTLAGGKATGNAAGGSLIFSTSDAGASGTTLQSLTEKMRISAAGNVGIGTTTPATKLHTVVDGVGRTTQTAVVRIGSGTTGGGYYFPTADFATKSWSTGDSSAKSQLDILLSDGNTAIPETTVMSLRSDGKVGIGDTTPDYLLDVAGTAGFDGLITAGIGISPDADDGAYLGQSGSAFSDLFLASGGVINWNAGDVTLTHSADTLTLAGGALDIQGAVTMGTGTEAMRITTAGNLKIAGTADRATTEGTNHLDIFDGTAPVGTLANGISLYSASGELYVLDAAGNATLLSPHENEHNYWVFNSANTETGKSLIIDMELIMKDINNSFELDYIHETQDGKIVPRSTDGSLLGKLFSKVSAWLANATNGIAKIFTKEIETQTLCVSDESGDKTCITKSQLDALILNAGSSGSSSSSSSSGGGGGSPAPEPELPEDTGTPTDSVVGTEPVEGEPLAEVVEESAPEPETTPTPPSQGVEETISPPDAGATPEDGQGVPEGGGGSPASAEIVPALTPEPAL
ncbi:MAG: hypothetical protein WCT29_00065 [Candidatus Paceibacterota bacterium]|jgi:hypothetical protein